MTGINAPHHGTELVTIGDETFAYNPEDPDDYA